MSDSAIGTQARLQLEGWAGRRSVLVTIVGETRTRCRVRLEAGTNLPRRGWYAAGAIVTVPKSALEYDAVEGEL